MRFQKIPKSAHTVNLYSEFSCKSRFANVDFAITSYLWTPNVLFVSGIDLPCFLVIKNKDTVFPLISAPGAY